MPRLFLFIISLFVSLNLHAVQRYQSTVDTSEWQVNSSLVQCEMIHPINHFGKGRFVFNAGGELAFQLHTWESARQNSVVSLSSTPAFWRSGEDKELAQLTLSKGKIPIYLGGNLAFRMLYELQEGYHPTFHYKDWAGFEDDVYVSFSSANFHRPYDKFKQCMNAMLDYGADQLKDTAVYFATDKSGLTKKQRKKLTEIILFAKVDKGLKIQLKGHADGRGRRQYNKKLSARRTNAVEKFLVSKGVSESQISLNYHGESRPVGSNRSYQGQKSNRRVDVIIKHE